MMKGSKLFWLVALCLSLGPARAFAAESAAAEGKLTDRVPQPSEAPNNRALPAIKASVSSLYLDLTGVRPASDASYSFGQIAITVESLAVEAEIQKGTNAYVKGQYLTNEYALMSGGKTYSEYTAGMGDTLIGLNHTLLANGGFTLLADVGGYVPTGSINQTNPYLAGTAHTRYKYFLQLGSGTFDETGGLTALYKQSLFQTGLNGKTILRNYNNSNGYHMGDCFAVNGWFDAPLKHGFTPRLTGSYRARTAMHGQDDQVNRAGAEFYYHDQIDWNVSLALRYTYQLAKSAALVAEVGAPIAQGMINSDNVNLDTNFYGSVSAAGTF